MKPIQLASKCENLSLVAFQPLEPMFLSNNTLAIRDG